MNVIYYHYYLLINPVVNNYEISQAQTINWRWKLMSMNNTRGSSVTTHWNFTCLLGHSKCDGDNLYNPVE